MRLLGECAPPLYLYFIRLPPGGWDRAQVTRQTRDLSLVEVVIAQNQDLLPLSPTLQVRPLSSL